MDELERMVVQAVITEGRHGQFAWVSHPKLGSVTFSLEPEVWHEEDVPSPGSEVMIGKYRKKRAGWRAMYARYVTPADITATSKEHGARSNEH